MGGVLCRPLRRHRCRDQSRKPWRERPRCARWKWPRACPEGSLTPWLSVSCVGRVGRPRAAGRSRSRRETGPHVRAERNSDLFRTIRSRSCGKSWSRTALVRCPLRSAKRVNNRGHVGYVGHHAIDARSVLGTVQGSSLRSARAYARPAGLDGACAQITSWPLRDGRRMNAATGGAGLAICGLIPAVRSTRAITALDSHIPAVRSSSRTTRGSSIHPSALG